MVSQKSVQTRITMQALVQRTDILRILSTVDFLCVTVDMWSLLCDPGNCFISMTAHWIGPDLKIQSVLLSCRRFREEPTYLKVVETISQILGLYNIQNDKICCLVTNTGSNHLPTRIYHIQHLDDSNGEKSPHEEEVEEICNDDLTFVNLSTILSSPPSDEESVQLPSHYDCPTQTLVSVLHNSVFEALSNADLPTSYVFQSSIAKCQAVWKACSYKEVEEKIQESYGVRIMTPNKLNWNSFLESIMSLLSSKQVMDEIFQFFELPNLEENEWEFLEEYVMAMTPITKALNVLQDENDLYMGSFVPTILTVKTKLEEMLGDEDSMVDLARPLVEALLNGLNGPFMDIIALNERARPLILASILHPFFKLRWIPADKVEELKSWYLEEAMNYAKAIEDNNGGDSAPASQPKSNGNKRGRKSTKVETEENDFFPFSSETEKEEPDDVSTSVLLEFIQYVDVPCEKIESGQLDRFPNVKKLFITFNTAIASSVPVERLIKFSEVSQAPPAVLLKDELFENMLLLKCN